MNLVPDPEIALVQNIGGPVLPSSAIFCIAAHKKLNYYTGG
jgi:hypothetical protein